MVALCFSTGCTQDVRGWRDVRNHTVTTVTAAPPSTQLLVRIPSTTRTLELIVLPTTSPEQYTSATTIPVPSGPLTVSGLDAHDGDLLQIGDTAYLYGTSYGCGFVWGQPSPFCGFRLYTSRDMRNWLDHGLIFDPTVMQGLCDGAAGCFNPRVRQVEDGFLLWFNIPRRPGQLARFRAQSPLGPWQPDRDQAAAGNGDFTIWREGGQLWVFSTAMWQDIVITGPNGESKLGRRDVESPGVFKALGTYFLTVSDPNCGYCNGKRAALGRNVRSGLTYYTASRLPGPWTYRGQLIENAYNGQPRNVVMINRRPYEWIDLWVGTPKEAAAAVRLQPLTILPDSRLSLTGAVADENSP